MTQPKTARGADLEAPLRTFCPGVTSLWGPRGSVSAQPSEQHGPSPDQTVSALDRLIARIQTGTATPEDIDDLPEGVVDYLHAALTLDEMGVLGADWEVTPTGGIIVRGTVR